MLAGVAVVAAAALVVLVWLSTSLAVRRPAILDGARAPAFSLRSLRGSEQITLAEFRGKTVVINFFASWCAPCELEAADLQQTWRDYEHEGDVTFLGVAIQDEYSAARGFLDKHGLTYPAVFDASSSMMQTYRITGIPTTIVVDPEGRVAYRYAGTFLGDQGRAALRSRIDAARRPK
jgi:cytochrome c biogenesis protein CcmG/thiol:disulfide interchange protein DsbE